MIWPGLHECVECKAITTHVLDDGDGDAFCVECRPECEGDNCRSDATRTCHETLEVFCADCWQELIEEPFRLARRQGRLRYLRTPVRYGG
jgi:hypothetical protein